MLSVSCCGATHRLSVHTCDVGWRGILLVLSFVQAGLAGTGIALTRTQPCRQGRWILGQRASVSGDITSSEQKIDTEMPKVTCAMFRGPYLKADASAADSFQKCKIGEHYVGAFPTRRDPTSW